MSYIGNPIISTDFPKDTFSGNGSTTAFTMSIAPASVNAIIVVVSGITQDPSTYTISGTTLTFSGAPPTGTSNISVRHLGIAGIPNTPSAGSVVATSIADGVITAAKFASGQTPAFNGIAFPATQSASADANTLDDYEEGTWTPTVNSGTIDTGNKGYIKVGRLVTVWAVISGFSDRSSASQITVGGFPFASASFGSVAATSTLYRYCSTPPSFYLQATASSAQIYSSSTGGYVTFNYNALTNSQAEMYINFTYEASA
jgi:hypothetical protein